NNTAYMSVAQAFYNVVKTIALNPDGNIPVMYISTLGGAAHLATTTGNMIQYVPNGQGVLLYVNPLSAVSEVLLALSKPQTDAEFVTKTSPIDTPAALRSEGAASADAYRIAMSPEIKDALIKSLLATIAPQLSQGIPLEMAPTQEGADIYFNTQTSVTFMANLMQNLLSNPVIAGTLKEYLQSIHLPQIPDGDVEAVLAQLPAYLEKTTKLEIGLSLVRMK
ncbi:MAG: hypothetical protein K2K29_03505, partial [Muribaculaceae bacterium]|nr:hypothetical protein [Muribaculaceae bacterium]